MNEDILFEEATGSDPWGTPKWRLRIDLLNGLRQRPVAEVGDLRAATALARLIHDELESYGTGGGQRLDDGEIEVAQRALRAVLHRLGIEITFQWRDFTGFRTYWNRNGAHGSYQARREMLTDLFDPIMHQIAEREDAGFAARVAEPVSPHTATGWPAVDAEITELTRLFRSARTPQDYRDVGNRCVGVLEALSRTIYDPARHLRDGESEPPVDRTNQRLGRYIEDSLGGAMNAEVRGVAIKVSELAHKIKHRPTATRRDAGIAADAAVLLANILRRIDEPT